jgi:Tol biopolymer transport system component
VEKDVLVQLFERRVLTYTPSNPAGFQVEMGNVGQHYYRWRYMLTPVPNPPPQPVVQERIAFTSDRSGSPQIWTMDVNGGDVKQLTNSGDNEWPSWSPDNSKIASQSHRDGNWEIYVMDADGPNQKRLTIDSANLDLGPDWSPDGSRIIWNKGMQTYTMTANGGDQTSVAFVGLLESAPIYSPDGQELAYGAYVTGNQKEVFTGKFGGTDILRLTYRTNTNDTPTDWKGHKMLFVAMPPTGAGDAWLMDDDGGNQQQIGWSVYERAGFSGDGTHVVLQSGTSWQESEIWIGCTDFSCGGTNISNSPGFDGEPDWTN